METNKKIISKIKKRNLKLIVSFGLLILMSYYASALAVSSPFWLKDGVKLAPGETQKIEFVLQNMAGDSDVNMKAGIIEGSEIAKIADSSDVYSVPLGTQKKVEVELSAPENAELGSEQDIKIAFTTLTIGEAGTFNLGSSIEKNFKVIIQEKTLEEMATEEQKTGAEKLQWVWIYIAIAIIVLIIVILLIIRKRR